MSRCRVAPNGKHTFMPVENGELVYCEYLESNAARWWECEWCGQRSEFEGRWAAAPRARR